MSEYTSIFDVRDVFFSGASFAEPGRRQSTKPRVLAKARSAVNSISKKKETSSTPDKAGGVGSVFAVVHLELN